MADTTSAYGSYGVGCLWRNRLHHASFIRLLLISKRKSSKSNGDVVLRGVLNAETIAQLTGKALHELKSLPGLHCRLIFHILLRLPLVSNSDIVLCSEADEFFKVF